MTKKEWRTHQGLYLHEQSPVTENNQTTQVQGKAVLPQRLLKEQADRMGTQAEEGGAFLRRAFMWAKGSWQGCGKRKGMAKAPCGGGKYQEQAADSTCESTVRERLLPYCPPLLTYIGSTCICCCCQCLIPALRELTGDLGRQA